MSDFKDLFTIENLQNLIPLLNETKYLYLFFFIIFAVIFLILSLLIKSSIKKESAPEVERRKPNLNDIVDSRNINVSDDNEFVDVLVAIEEEMTAIRELYVGGYISKGVYISETDRLYEKAKIFGV
jgi:hypothetical protein